MGTTTTEITNEVEEFVEARAATQPRHIHLTREMLANFRDTDRWELPPEDLDVLGTFALCKDESGGVAGHKFELESRWVMGVAGVRAVAERTAKGADSCLVCFGTGRECGACIDADSNTLCVETDRDCTVCPALAEARRRLPPKLRWINYRHLIPAPISKVPVPIAKQQKHLHEIQSGDLDDRSLCIMGPSRVGKSVLASALLHSMTETYIWRGFLDQYPEHELPIYRTNADEWVAKYEANARYKFGTVQPPPPELNIISVDQLLPRDPGATAPIERPDHFPPVFVIEEIDKVNWTKSRMNALFAVLKKISEAGGMVVSTSNDKEEDLRKRVPNHFWRMLAESNLPDDDDLRIISFFKSSTKKKAS